VRDGPDLGPEKLAGDELTPDRAAVPGPATAVQGPGRLRAATRMRMIISKR
jgi:hypothetical protein